VEKIPIGKGLIALCKTRR